MSDTTRAVWWSLSLSLEQGWAGRAAWLSAPSGLMTGDVRETPSQPVAMCQPASQPSPAQPSPATRSERDPCIEDFDCPCLPEEPPHLVRRAASAASGTLDPPSSNRKN
ncbi:hypothetical protein IWZ03DRAFT_359679 [Phyllosticta citriasiana]|uniref:Secreted protein n=1 Tax=Phyllosticta citriasiana TaxID=595635 RepID=A0ABR1KM81_9PEZI